MKVGFISRLMYKAIRHPGILPSISAMLLGWIEVRDKCWYKGYFLLRSAFAFSICQNNPQTLAAPFNAQRFYDLFSGSKGFTCAKSSLSLIANLLQWFRRVFVSKSMASRRRWAHHAT